MHCKGLACVMPSALIKKQLKNQTKDTILPQNPAKTATTISTASSNQKHHGNC
jgi:hypothetical protein